MEEGPRAAYPAQRRMFIETLRTYEREPADDGA
jgi:hypothetical protein